MTTLAEVRLKACAMWPLGTHAILSMAPVAMPGLGTLAIDQHWRLYYDQAVLDSKPVDESAGVILHEVSHLLLRHHKRAETLLGKDADKRTFDRWNVATDYAINSMLRRQGIKLWDGVLYPEQAGFARELSGEEYFRLLAAQEDEQAQDAQDGTESDDSQDGTESGQDGQDAASEASGDEEGQSNGKGEGDGDEQGQETGEDRGSAQQDRGTGSETGSGGSEGGASESEMDAGSEATGCDGAGCESGPATQPGCGDGGSCADGRQRPWELPADIDGDLPSLKPHEQDIIVRQTAERIMDKTCGDQSGAWEHWAKDVINPRVDPRLALHRMVRQAVEMTSGTGDYSYRRPNRRNPHRDILRPSAVQPIPRITVIVDTSGSMDKRDLGLSLGMIGKVLNGFRIRDGIQVICGDTQAVVEAKAFDPKSIKLAGGGGTDMGSLIEHAAEAKPRPQLIVVCTDGDTPWCERVSVPVVACVTQEFYAKQVPAWIRTVLLAE